MPESLRRLLDRALAACPRGATVLDAGCGTGVPVARVLIDRGCRVTGIDASAAMLAIASREVPEARLIHGDLRGVMLEETFDAIVAWDSVFHIPRDEHAGVFDRFHRWLRPPGMLVLSLGGSAWEGSSEMHGEQFHYSGFDPEDSLRLLRSAGFEIIESYIDDESSHGHLALLATAAGSRVVPEESKW